MPRAGARPRKFSDAFHIANAVDPFSPHAQDARIPDEYAAPTSTYKIVSTLTVTSSASGTFALALMPSPHVTSFLLSGTGTTTGLTFTANTKLCYAVSPNTTNALLDDFRVTGFGVRVRNLQAPGTATGMLEIAQVPAGTNVYPWTALESFGAADVNVVSSLLNNLTINGTVWASLLSLPDSDEYAVQELMANDLILIGKMVSADHTRFKKTSLNSAYSATLNDAESGLYTAADGNWVSNNSMSKEPTSCAGRTAMVFNGRGFPNSTRILDFEIIYHIEGTPAPITGPVWSSVAVPRSVVDPMSQVKTIVANSQLPASRIIDAAIAHRLGSMPANPIKGYAARLGMGAASFASGVVKPVAKGAAIAWGGIGQRVGKALVKKLVKEAVERSAKRKSLK